MNASIRILDVIKVKTGCRAGIINIRGSLWNKIIGNILSMLISKIDVTQADSGDKWPKIPLHVGSHTINQKLLICVIL